MSSRRPSLRVPALLIWFVVLWTALWGQFTWANLLAGIVVAVGLVIVVPLPGTDFRSYAGARVRPLRIVWFLAYFLVKVVQANVMLAWEVVTPKNTIEQGILGIHLRNCSDALVTLIANSFTLTPGSLTIEVRREPDNEQVASIYVHVLHLHDPDKVRKDLHHLARLAVRAFGSAEALAQFDTPMTRTPMTRTPMTRTPMNRTEDGR